MPPHITRLLACGLLVRTVVLFYATWHDDALPVRYTDVDYDVFTDAACFVHSGQSPYARQTYRYPPLLAWLLVPACTAWLPFGKLLFCVADVLCAALLYAACAGEARGRTATAALWLFNPVVVNVSTRGNAESLVLLPIVAALCCTARAREPATGGFVRLGLRAAAAALLGAAVHMRLFPVIYLPSVALDVVGSVLRGRTTCAFGAAEAAVGAASFGAAFAGLTAWGYAWYGTEYLENAYFYHYGRVDHRHNLSPYFLPVYLGESVQGGFLPQLAALLAVSYAFVDAPAFCWFACTAVFVTLNKVVTVQYFSWYLCLLPPALRYIKMRSETAAALAALWAVALLAWLLSAHELEFQGLPAFGKVWAASLAFMAVNTATLCTILAHYASPAAAKVKGS